MAMLPNNKDVNMIPKLSLFSMGDSDLLPSEQRRRLSAQLTCSTIGEENSFLQSIIIDSPTSKNIKATI